MEVTDRLGIFAKYWQAGMVKTRLAAAVEAGPAAILHGVFLRTLVQRFASYPASRVLCYWPPESEPDFTRLAAGDWQLEPQSAGDLGQRMKSFFQDSFDQGFARVVLIGSDSPTLPISIVDEAFESLSTHPVVIGPSVDGGYYLIGLRGPQREARARVSERRGHADVPPIFDGIEWSTSRVFHQTLDRLAAARVPVAQLRPWYDVDELPDLQQLAAELSGNVDDSLQELRTAVSSVLGKHVDG